MDGKMRIGRKAILGTTVAYAGNYSIIISCKKYICYNFTISLNLVSQKNLLQFFSLFYQSFFNYKYYFLFLF